VSSVAQLVAGPLTGLGMDRWGRKPLLILGLALRASSGFAQFFAPGYVEFVLLEFVGAMGVAMWSTGSAVLIADLSIGENRGRAVAARSTSARLGNLLGPLIGGAIATAFGLRAVFLFNGVSKLSVLIIVLLLIRETRPQLEGPVRRPMFDSSLVTQFMTRSFVIIALASLTVSLMSQGVFSTLFPLFLKDSSGFTTAQIGTLQSLAGIAILVVAFPNGYLVDRFGRKATLIPGLIVLGMSALFLSHAVDFHTALLVVIVYGIGSAMCMGAAQVYVMDLAPRERRGAFLGMWALLDNSGGVVTPLLVGFTAGQLGFTAAFAAAAGLLGTMAILMWIYGPDTYHRRQTESASREPTAARR
jgi:MFS family permease